MGTTLHRSAINRSKTCPKASSQWSANGCQYEANSLQAAKEKLLLFPSGTEFQWRAGARDERAEKAWQKLSSFAAEHGMKITGRTHSHPRRWTFELAEI